MKFKGVKRIFSFKKEKPAGPVALAFVHEDDDYNDDDVRMSAANSTTSPRRGIRASIGNREEEEEIKDGVLKTTVMNAKFNEEEEKQNAEPEVEETEFMEGPNQFPVVQLVVLLIILFGYYWISNYFY